MIDSSQLQGGIICAAAALLGLIFLGGLLSGAYWAVAIPVALLLAFVLGLAFWVGWTIATVRVEPEEVDEGGGESGGGSEAGDAGRDGRG